MEQVHARSTSPKYQHGQGCGDLLPCPVNRPKTITTLLLDLGLLQKDIANEISVNKSTITNWELNHNFPQLRYVPALIEFLGYWPYDTPVDNLGQQIVAKRPRLGLSQKSLGR